MFSHFLSESHKRKMSASAFFPIMSCVDTSSISEHCTQISRIIPQTYSLGGWQTPIPSEHTVRLLSGSGSIQGARCNRRTGFILCYFRNLFQLRMLLCIKWGTAKATVRKLNQGYVSTISRAAKYQSAQTVSISKQEPCTYRICSHQTDLPPDDGGV